MRPHSARAKISNVDESILEKLALCYGCKICNGILIETTLTDCGHRFCSYCIQMLSKLCHECPHCTQPFKNLTPFAQVDREIHQLVSKGSFELQENFKTRRLMRNKSNQEVSQTSSITKRLEKQKNKGTTNEKFFKEIFEILNSPNKPGSDKKTDNTSAPAQTRKNSRTLVPSATNNYVYLSGVERSKVDSLFSVYDRICTIVANVNGDSANGGFGDTGMPNSETSSVVALPPVNHRGSPATEMRTQSRVEKAPTISPAMKSMDKKHRSEIETMIKEIDKVLQVELFLKKWSLEVIGSVEKDENNGGEGSSEYETMVRASTALAERHQAMKAQLQQKMSEERSLVPFSAPNAINLSSELPEGDFDVELSTLHNILEDQKSKSVQEPIAVCPGALVDPKKLFSISPQIELEEMIEQEKDTANKKFLGQLLQCKEALRQLTSMTNPDAISKLVPQYSTGGARPKTSI